MSCEAQAVIAGIGHTAHGKLPGRTPVSLTVEAVANALADAGVEKDVVDAVFCKYPTSTFHSMYGQEVAEALGLQPRIGGVWDQGGATNISMISWAVESIAAGQCEVALVTTADNPRTGTRQAYERAWGDDAVYGWFSTPRRLRDDRPASHGAVRHDQRAARGDRGRLPQARGDQPERVPARADDARRPPGLADGRRAAASRRLLPDL